MLVRNSIRYFECSTLYVFLVIPVLPKYVYLEEYFGIVSHFVYVNVFHVTYIPPHEPG
jgi:hypothetical protein